MNKFPHQVIQSNFFSVFNKITGKQSNLILPTDTPPECLPDKFNSFFIEKIAKIRSNLDSLHDIDSYDNTEFTGNC